MKKNALIIMIIALITKFIGLGKDIVLSYYYGASSISDAYIIAITIPSVIFSFVAGGLGAGYTPIYNRVLSKSGHIEANSFTINLINVLLVLSSFIVVGVLIFTDQIVAIFASGFDQSTFKLAVMLTRISIIAIYFTGIITILNSYIRIQGNYLVPALSGLPMNLFLVFSIVTSVYTEEWILALGYSIAVASQLILIIPCLIKLGYNHSFILSFRDENIKQMLFLSIPIIIGVAVNDINILVDRTIASNLAVGGITSLNYASRLMNFVQGIFVMSIVTVVFPLMSNYIANDDITKFKSSLSEGITCISLLTIPAAVGSIVFSTPIVSLLFQRGSFDLDALIMTSSALTFYSIGMIGIGLRSILSKAFYALHDTKTPMINAAVGAGLNIILNILLSRLMGLSGLALATSISAIFIMMLLLFNLRKKIGPFGMKQISISFLKILFASLVMGGLTKLSFNYLTVFLSQNSSLLIAIGVGAVSYFVIIYFMKIEDVDVIVGVIKKKLGRVAA